MKRSFPIVLLFAAFLVTALSLCAQTPAGGAAQPGQNKPAVPPPQTGSNPFPEDTSTVPVMPSTVTPDLPVGTFSGSQRDDVTLSGDDQDPVRSPDDPATLSGAGQEQDSGSSSSSSSLDSLLPASDDDQPGKRRKHGAEAKRSGSTPHTKGAARLRPYNLQLVTCNLQPVTCGPCICSSQTG